MPTAEQCKVFRHTARFATFLAGVYLLAGVLWIALSDRLLKSFVADPAMLTQLQTKKGWAFVLITAVLLWGLVFRRDRALLKSRTSLRAAHENLQAMFDASPAAIIAVDVNGQIIAWNQSAQKLFGWSADEVIGADDPTICLAGQHDVRQSSKETDEGNQINNRVETRRRKSGDSVKVDVTLAPLRDDSGEVTGVIYVMLDASARLRIERLEHERRSLAAARSAQDEALAVIGHELRTPLAGIRAVSEYLIDGDASQDTEQAESFIESIHNEVCRMTEMVNNMLEAARLKNGESRWKWGEVDLEELSREAVEIVRPLADNRAITFGRTVHPEGALMRGDRQAIHRLLLNLLSNAIKNTKEGEIAVDVHTVTGPEHRWIQIKVSDSGSGIDPKMAEKLGRAFAASSGSISSSSTGIGLGLAICREIAAAHGGKIMVSSSAGKGATFAVMMRGNLDEPVEHEQPPEIILEAA